MENSYDTSHVVLTIGHSTRTLDAFISLLQAHSVTMVVDIRTVPRSRHNPQFNSETLPGNLRAAGITHLSGVLLTTCRQKNLRKI